MSDDVNLNIGINVDEIQDELEETNKAVEDTKQASRIAIRSIMNGLRKATQLSILMVEAVSGSIDAVTRYAIEGMLMTAEALTTIFAAEALTVVGAFKVGVQIASVIAIYVQINKMVHQRNEQAQQMGRVAIFLRTLGMSF